MSYCNLSDVQALNAKRVYGATSTPTATQVLTLIDQVATEIDMVLSVRGYTVPVTTAGTLLSFLKTLNAQGAAALAEQAMFPETGEPGATPHWKMLWAIYQGWIKDLKAGVIPETSSGLHSDIDDLTEELDGPKFSMDETVRQF